MRVSEEMGEDPDRLGVGHCFVSYYNGCFLKGSGESKRGEERGV